MKTLLFFTMLVGIVYLFSNYDTTSEPVAPPEKAIITLHDLPVPPVIAGTAPLPDQTVLDYLKLHTSTQAVDFRKIKSACNHRKVRLQAHSLISKQNTGQFNVGMIADLYDHVITNWNYIPDAIGAEEPALASESGQLFRGDTDDFAVYLASLLWAVGGQIRVFYAESSSKRHAFVQVNLGQTDLYATRRYLSTRYRVSPDQINIVMDIRGDSWLNLDCTTRHPGAAMRQDYHADIFYPQGNFIEVLP